MAGARRTLVLFLAISNCFGAEDFGGSNRARTFPSEQRLDQWAKSLDGKLQRILHGDEDVTGAAALTKIYQDAFDDGVGYSIEKPDGNRIIEDMRNEIGEVFERNIEALEELHSAAENAVKNYTFDETLMLSQVDYVNVNDMADLVNLTEYSDHFKQNIYAESSGVQIPIEIYEGYPRILNSIAWTQALDEVFKANRARYPDIYWQSFGSQEGILRVYPASQWRTVDDMPDLFDVRRRPWYIHGTSSPKDMVILLDTSGSMHGQSFDIMKIAAKTLLNTLGENDYVNVAAFSRNVSWVTPCLRGLVQANARNKRLLFDGIDQLVDRNIASYSQALKFAYTELESFDRDKDDQDGSECHKLIMVFSDGGTENPAKILDVYTNSSRGMTSNARIFTYAVGPHPLPTVALKDMACATGGSFSVITAMGAIRTKIQDYIRILNRPLVLSKYFDFFKSTFFSRDHMGLGFVTTITKPVFNSSLKSDNQTLAGIVGIDIPVSRFEAFAPKAKLGPLGYSFGLNANGFLIFHPKLWLFYNYLEEPVHNDLEDVEGGSEKLSMLRKEMIDLAVDDHLNNVRKVDINASVILHQGHSATVEMEYFYTAIKKSLFSLAIVLPKFWKYVNVPAQFDAAEILEQMIKYPYLKLAPRKFCDESKSNDGVDSAEEMLTKLKENRCHGRDFNHLLWDLKLTAHHFQDSLNPKLKTQFVITDGGALLTRFSDPLQSRNSILKVDPYNSTLYKMAVLSPSPIVYVQKYVSRQVIPIYFHSSSEDDDQEDDIDEDDDTFVSDESEGSQSTTASSSSTTTLPPPKFVMQLQPPSIFLAQAIRIDDGDADNVTTVAVSGVELTHEYLKDLMLNATDSSDHSELDCRNWSSELMCYLVDTSGYIIASNQDKSLVDVGDFLGVADPEIMGHLISGGAFQSRIEYNYQALCPTEINCKTDGVGHLPRLFLATIAQHLWALMQQLNYGIFSVFALLGQPLVVESASEYTKQVTEGLHRCTTKTEHWEWKMGSHYDGLHDRIDVTCKGIPCVRQFHSYRLRNLNAIMIVADPKWCDFCKPPPLFDGPLEAPAGDDCQLPRRYRRRPEECFATHDDESFECSSGSASNFLASLLVTVLPFLIVFL